jgi:malate permease and related proteins
VVIGYSTRLRRGALSRPARTVAIRLAAWVALAVPFSVLLVQGVLGLDPLFAAAVMTMAILPPPFVIPLYMGTAPGDAAERDYVADTLSLATVATLAAFTVVAAAFSG